MKGLSSPNKKRDTVYADPRARVSQFVFDEGVVDVFPDMIKRSVPGYATAISMTGVLTARYAQPGSNCYDLGCSLGASTIAMAHGMEHVAGKIIAVDNAPAMIEKCRMHLNQAGLSTPVHLICQDLRETAIDRASVVVLNYTLQFVTPEERLAVLQTIYNGLLPGGVLILSEKVVSEDPTEQALINALHLDFKRANGYSELEISQKRTALENVLIPDSIERHKSRLVKAGFSSANVWFQCLNFASLIAVKEG